MSRLNEMRALQDGWFGPRSLAPSHFIIDELRHVSSKIPPNARLAPAADGSIVVEWDLGEREYMVSIDRTNRVYFLEEDADGNVLRELERPYTNDFLSQALAGTATN